MDPEERLAVFLDYENLALGAREHLGGMAFDFGPIADALAVRGRVVVRRAYADWSYFSEDRRALTRHHVELIEMPQHMGASRKNAADIKMVVDAIEMAFERDYISTFVVCTGDSDFSPLVHKLRELNKRVIGVGVENSTSRLLPPACDEFLFYDGLEGVDVPAEPERAPKTEARGARGVRGQREAAKPPAAVAADVVEAAVEASEADGGEPERASLEVFLAQTLGDLEASTGGAVTASVLKRALRRKDPAFSEAGHGFRAFGELLRDLASRGVVELADGPAQGDPAVSLPAQGDRAEAFALLRTVLEAAGEPVALSGLKNRLRKARPAFSEKALGFRGFLQFCKAAQEAGVVTLAWDDATDDYAVTAAR